MCCVVLLNLTLYIGDEDSASFEAIHTVDSNKNELFVSLTCITMAAVSIDVGGMEKHDCM